jgi:hypothetical protein
VSMLLICVVVALVVSVKLMLSNAMARCYMKTIGWKTTSGRVVKKSCRAYPVSKDNGWYWIGEFNDHHNRHDFNGYS